MANIKPAELQTGHLSNEEIIARKEAEQKLKGNTQIDIKPPKELSTNGKRLYKKIISLLPNGFLNGGDTFVVNIVAESLDRMQECQIKINTDGMFDERGNESQAVKTYERYSKIFEKFSQKLGLSPKDRASLAVLVLNDKENQEDPLLKVLRGDDD
jgi:P27 family predicted phage terminase small subunit